MNPPRNLFVTDAGYSTWDPPASRDLLGYNIYIDSVLVDFTTDLYYQYTDLTNNQTYLAGVSALYDDGESEIIEYQFTYLETCVENVIIHEAKLIDNYPNPFNHITTISFTTLNFDKRKEITIYNLKGQIVKQLVKEQLSEGKHSVVWDGKDEVGNEVPSGVYFYKLICGEYNVTKKMLLIR